MSPDANSRLNMEKSILFREPPSQALAPQIGHRPTAGKTDLRSDAQMITQDQINFNSLLPAAGIEQVTATANP